jgi:hypothetical protein
MKTLCLHSVQSVKRADSTDPHYLLISSDDCGETPLVLWMTKAGELRIDSAKQVRPKNNRLASLLYRESANSNSQWLLAPMSSRVMHNGIRPLSLAIIEPGDVLAFENQRWLTTELWRPIPAPAPQAVAEKECSVCAGPMKLAPVIQCPCGRYYHLEHPDNPDDPQALNCYLTAGMCGLCERKPSLDPQFLPLPPEELIPQEELELAIASV